jgi:hypothetical protein
MPRLWRLPRGITHEKRTARYCDPKGGGCRMGRGPPVRGGNPEGRAAPQVFSTRPDVPPVPHALQAEHGGREGGTAQRTAPSQRPSPSWETTQSRGWHRVQMRQRCSPTRPASVPVPAAASTHHAVVTPRAHVPPARQAKLAARLHSAILGMLAGDSRIGSRVRPCAIVLSGKRHAD